MNITDRSIPESKVKNICDFFANNSDVAAVFLFGSYGTEFQLPTSDLDLGIVYCKMPELKDELDLDAELSCFLHTDNIDLINLNKAPVYLQFKVLKEGKLLLERDYVATSDFIERVSKQYWDYQIDQQQFMLDYEYALKEAYNIG